MVRIEIPKSGKSGWLLAALFFLALLSGCRQKSADVQAQAGQTVSTALFDFTVADPRTLTDYAEIEIPPGEKLVQMRLTVANTSAQTYTMFAEDFQIQWGNGPEGFGPCLPAVDDRMVPYGYELTPGDSRESLMLALVPEDCTALTVAYAEQRADGQRAAAYFVEVPL